MPLKLSAELDAKTPHGPGGASGVVLTPASATATAVAATSSRKARGRCVFPEIPTRAAYPHIAYLQHQVLLARACSAGKM